MIIKVVVSHLIDYETAQIHSRKRSRSESGNMEPTTIRLETEEVATIDAEAERRGFSTRASYLRYIIRNRPTVEPTTAESLDERMSEFEERLEQIESVIKE